VHRGQRTRIEIPVGRMPSQVMVNVPVRVVHGARDGAKLWLSAAIHGDEINGVEIIRQVLDILDPGELRGSVVAVPIVNVFGFSMHSRYLPDRRDLNRSFPGSTKGSLASRLAKIVMDEVVEPCSYGIDLHTGAAGRMNLPQVRCNLEDEETRRCAEAFGAPLMMHSAGPGGSLRRTATVRGKRVLVYEAGEVLRYNPVAIEVGVDGVLGVMQALDMIDPRPRTSSVTPVASYKQKWVRAQRGGIVRMQVELGERVVRRQPLGVVADPMGEQESAIRSPGEGYVIGGITNPLVLRGDAVLNIALVDRPEPEEAEMRAQLDKPLSDASETMQLPAEPANGPENGEET
jgi:predicted deacylase